MKTCKRLNSIFSILTTAVVLFLLSGAMVEAGGESFDSYTDPGSSNIVGYIFWPNGNPLQDVKVKVTVEDIFCIKKKEVWCDEEGYYSLWLSPGCYHIYVDFDVDDMTFHFQKCGLQVNAEERYLPIKLSLFSTPPCDCL